MVECARFYRETEFQKMPTGKIPQDWKATKLVDAADYINGYGFSPKEWTSEGLPIIRIQNLNDPYNEFNYFNGAIDEKYLVETGDLLFAWSASIGAYVWKGKKAVLNQHIFKVIPKEGIDRRFLHLALSVAMEQLKNRVHGSTMQHFKRGELKTTLVPVPSLAEQKRIIAVLDVVDSSIDLAGKVIAKTERLKKGLMQQLLTRGIGHKEYTDTPIGKTPKTWQTARLGEILIDVKYGTSVKANSSNQGFPVLGIPNILGGKIDEASLRYVDLPDSERQNLTLEDGDILLVRTNANPDYIGRCALFENKTGVWLYASYLIRIRPDKKRVLPVYLVKFLQSERARRQFLSIARTSAGNYNINSQGIRAVTVSLPSLPEQQRIAMILSTIESKLELEHKEKKRLERIKRSLMDLLLTGKIRVKVD